MDTKDSFYWGVADSDLQVVGEASTLKEEGAEPTMWSVLASTSDAVHNRAIPGIACDRYHRWREDVELIAQLGVSHYRCSISMARLITRDGSTNGKAVKWYREFFKALRDRGIAIHATLYHWELPHFLYDLGGWSSLRTVEHYVKHCSIAAAELGDLVSDLALFNEHMSIVFLGYQLGWHAPFERDFRKALLVGHNILLAQGAGFREIRKIAPQVRISTVYNPMMYYAAGESPEQLRAQRLATQLSADWLMDPVFLGRYPTELTEYIAASDLPAVGKSDLEEIRIGPELDALGLNYYFGLTVDAAEEGITRSRVVSAPLQITNSLGWPVYLPPYYPKGLRDLLVRTFSRYQAAGLKTLYIAENGTAWGNPSNPSADLHDTFRVEYMKQHIEQVHEARRMGVPVEGYFAWTLMDNYEWQEGYRPESRFGLIHVDWQTLRRTPKDSYAWYQELVRG